MEALTINLVFVVIGVLTLMLGVVILVAGAAGDKHYAPYRGVALSMSKSSDENVARVMVRFDAQGEQITCQAEPIHFRAAQRLLQQEVTVFARCRKGRRSSTWKCFIDTGSMFSRPGLIRWIPLPALFGALGILLTVIGLIIDK